MEKPTNLEKAITVISSVWIGTKHELDPENYEEWPDHRKHDVARTTRLEQGLLDTLYKQALLVLEDNGV